MAPHIRNYVLYAKMSQVATAKGLIAGPIQILLKDETLLRCDEDDQVLQIQLKGT